MQPSEISGPPAVVRLVSDPLRWRLLHELAVSDRRVRELVAAVGQPQNLVSYHLRQLRMTGLVAARRSSFDRRDTYYHLDLDHYSHAWAEAAAALHPGLRPGAETASVPDGRPWRVLFLCTGNSARSPMAETLLRHRAGGAVEAASAGSNPKPGHPNAALALAEYGITLMHDPTHLDTLRDQPFDLVISLCDRVREVCPRPPDWPMMIHWSIADPAGTGDSDATTYQAFRHTAADLDTRIRFLLRSLAARHVRT